MGKGNMGHKEWMVYLFKNFKEIKCDVSAFYLKYISGPVKGL